MMVTIKGSFEFEEGASVTYNINKLFADLCVMLKHQVATITVTNGAEILTRGEIKD